jgi:hypothetical protein
LIMPAPHEKNGHACNGTANGHVEPANRLPDVLNGHAEPPSPNGDNGAAPGGAEAPPAGRDANGRFTKGNRGGPGNPHSRHVAKLRSALVNAVTEEDMVAIARNLVGRAKLGFVAPLKILLQYVLGRPAEAVDPDEMDLREWQLADSSPTRTEVLRALFNNLPAAAAAELVCRRQPGDADGVLEDVVKDNSTRTILGVAEEEKRRRRK